MLYRVCSAADWSACQREGQLPPAALDRKDGFIHLSAGAQVRETLARYFRGHPEVMLLEVEPDRLPPRTLRWEPSRGGARFPHLYGVLPRAAIVRAARLEYDENDVPLPPGWVDEDAGPPVGDGG